MSEESGRAEMERRLVQRSMEDEDFRQKLLDDPKVTLERELGRGLPEDMEVRVVEETQDTIYLVLPSASTAGPRETGGAVSDVELEAVAGGGDLPTFTCPPPEGASAPCNCN
jgi:hypothetical protein